MASGRAYGSRGGRGVKPYRRRKPLPALIVIAVLGLASAFVWVNLITTKEDINAAIRCEPAPKPPPGTTFTRLPHDALDDVEPIPPDKVALRVLNANGTRGQASLTTLSLKDIGFTKTAEPANDPAYPYPRRTAACHGQIRFGENGRAAARTVSLAHPCLELVRDNRKDATVDMSLGERFTDVRLTPEAKRILDRLTEWSAERAGVGNNQQSTAQAGPDLDPALLEAARDVTC
ncbi:LytR cell envelope-related transcriptional attenuator [Prauserella shujinwangii]|uniref:LytR cell envelope-related transcriptional attenuator n=1 Tax=Prauserella shujinwangii TaxID=1453103 RepID=A0A2T0M3E2_9PSEU|nr:envelope integrity protein Cei [Prauserella shujinwangii]PRX51263.1 LytR cell envelope-related transcriptional attenuator [Prauserella shujinwangii]